MEGGIVGELLKRVGVKDRFTEIDPKNDEPGSDHCEEKEGLRGSEVGAEATWGWEVSGKLRKLSAPKPGEKRDRLRGGRQTKRNDIRWTWGQGDEWVTNEGQ